MGRKYQMTVISLYLSQKSTSTLESLAFGEEGYILDWGDSCCNICSKC